MVKHYKYCDPPLRGGRLPSFWSTMLQGAGWIGGNVVGPIMNAQSVENTNEMNYKIAKESWSENELAAQRQMEFQERMSNSAYQRATEDMRAAGINPMVAFQQGGASSPAGASATHQAPTMQAPQYGNAASALASTAREVALFNDTLKNSASQRAVDAAVIDLKREEKRLTQEHTAKTANEAVASGVAAHLAVENAPAGTKEAALRLKQAEWDESLQGYDNVTRRIREGAGAVNSAMDVVKPGRWMGGGFKDLTQKQKDAIVRDEMRKFEGRTRRGDY